jgi:hypothetical protein
VRPPHGCRFPAEAFQVYTWRQERLRSISPWMSCSLNEQGSNCRSH